MKLKIPNYGTPLEDYEIFYTQSKNDENIVIFSVLFLGRLNSYGKRLPKLYTYQLCNSAIKGERIIEILDKIFKSNYDKITIKYDIEKRDLFFYYKKKQLWEINSCPLFKSNI